MGRLDPGIGVNQPNASHAASGNRTVAGEGRASRQRREVGPAPRTRLASAAINPGSIAHGCDRDRLGRRCFQQDDDSRCQARPASRNAPKQTRSAPPPMEHPRSRRAGFPHRSPGRSIRAGPLNSGSTPANQDPAVRASRQPHALSFRPDWDRDPRPARSVLAGHARSTAAVALYRGCWLWPSSGRISSAMASTNPLSAG